MDNLTKSQRIKCMKGNKRAGTKPEIAMKKLLEGFEYQPVLPGHPDFADRSRKVAVFVDGCFWHKCPEHFKMPKTNEEYWSHKIERNVERDKEIEELYSSMGWHTARLYEHELKGKNDLEVIDHILKKKG